MLYMSASTSSIAASMRFRYHASADPAFFSRIVAPHPRRHRQAARSSQTPVPTDELPRLPRRLAAQCISAFRAPEQIAAHFRYGDGTSARTRWQLAVAALCARSTEIRPGHARPSRPVCRYGWSPVSVGHEHRQGRRFLQRCRHHRRYVSVHRYLPPPSSSTPRRSTGFLQSIRDAVKHKVSVEELLRARKQKPARPKGHGGNAAGIRQRSIVAQYPGADRHPGYARTAARNRSQPRLLRPAISKWRSSTRKAKRAIDVFYLTSSGHKLDRIRPGPRSAPRSLRSAGAACGSSGRVVSAKVARMRVQNSGHGRRGGPHTKMSG